MGRGPAAEYHLATYVALAERLLDQLGVTRCDWVGTSMGGAIGLLGAAHAWGAHPPPGAQ